MKPALVELYKDNATRTAKRCEWLGRTKYVALMCNANAYAQKQQIQQLLADKTRQESYRKMVKYAETVNFFAALRKKRNAVLSA